MIYIILGLIVFGLLVAMVELVIKVPSVLIFVIGFVVLAVLQYVIVSAIQKKAYRYSPEEQKRLNAAKEQDRINVQRNHQRDMELNNQRRTRINAEIFKLEDALRRLQQKEMDLGWEIANTDVLAQKDLNLETVEYLIEVLESYRANSLSEALRLYDEKAGRDKAARQVYLAAMVQAETDRMMQRQQAQADFERRMDELAHRSRMEELERKQLEELERIRKDNEYYARYGKPN